MNKTAINRQSTTDFTEADLASWLTVQRQARRAGTLSQEHIDELDRLGISWVDFNSSADDYQAAVIERFTELGVTDGAEQVADNGILLADLQQRRWEAWEVADAVVAGEL